jgi:hypothetical protein
MPDENPDFTTDHRDIFGFRFQKKPGEKLKPGTLWWDNSVKEWFREPIPKTESRQETIT